MIEWGAIMLLLLPGCHLLLEHTRTHMLNVVPQELTAVQGKGEREGNSEDALFKF